MCYNTPEMNQTRPAHAAKAIFRVAIIIPQESKPNQERISGIFRYAATRPDWDVYLFGTHRDNLILDNITNWHADGIITTPELMRSHSFQAKAYAIANGRDFTPPPGCSNFGSIICDNLEIGRVGARFLMQKHLKNFAYVGMPIPQTWSQDRETGFRSELRKNGYGCAVFNARHSEGWASEEDHLARFINGLPKPCGILAAVDSRAKHVLDVCRLTGIKVPEQISVIGVDNEDMTCEWTQPSLTSILPEFELSGYRLAEMLDSLMHHRKVVPRVQRYGIVGIIERRSTLDLNGSARILARAREYMRLNAASPLSLQSIAAAAGCSVRMLQRHFREISGRTPIDELREMRLNLVAKMLTHSETPVNRIGEFCGFGSTSYLMAAFKQHYGCSMSAWRRQGRT